LKLKRDGGKKTSLGPIRSGKQKAAKNTEKKKNKKRPPPAEGKPTKRTARRLSDNGMKRSKSLTL